MKAINTNSAIVQTIELMGKWGILHGLTDNEMQTILFSLKNIATSAISDAIGIQRTELDNLREQILDNKK